MRLLKINLVGKTVLVNLEQIAFIEKDPDTHNAVITMPVATGSRPMKIVMNSPPL